jgi:DNA-binding LacI/PurR family transcriptional regulator
MNSLKRRPVTIIDVARRAGVSPSTVSRVINGTAVVVPETERRVREAIAEFNFSPHPAARQLVRQCTNMIGLLLPEISGAFFPPMLKGIEAGVREAGYDLLIYSTQGGRASRPLAEHNTDGLIIFPESVDEIELQRLHELGFPVVLLHRTPPQDISYPVITVENKSGAEMLINHLIEAHGRRRIVYLQGPESHEDSFWRERGYRESLETHGIAFDPELVAYGGFDEREAFTAIENLLLDGLEFDAVFAGDDDAAAGVILALKKAGRDVPNAVSVVGFDDVPFSRYINPPLTTVRAPIEQVGREAVRLLVKCIQKYPCESEVLLPTELIIRQSCGCH